MSFDVFFQGFDRGSAAGSGGALMRRSLEPYVEHGSASERCMRLIFEDCSADLYLSETSAMVNHVDGVDAWDALVTAAREANWVILPVGCLPCLTSPSQREHLPAELGQDGVVVVSSGGDLRRAIR